MHDVRMWLCPLVLFGHTGSWSRHIPSIFIWLLCNLEVGEEIKINGKREFLLLTNWNIKLTIRVCLVYSNRHSLAENYICIMCVCIFVGNLLAHVSMKNKLKSKIYTSFENTILDQTYVCNSKLNINLVFWFILCVIKFLMKIQTHTKHVCIYRPLYLMLSIGFRFWIRIPWYIWSVTVRQLQSLQLPPLGTHLIILHIARSHLTHTISTNEW